MKNPLYARNIRSQNESECLTSFLLIRTMYPYLESFNTIISYCESCGAFIQNKKIHIT